MNIRTLLLMVAEKTLKLQGNPFFKVTEEQYLTLYAKIYALVDVFLRVYKRVKVWTYFVVNRQPNINNRNLLMA